MSKIFEALESEHVEFIKLQKLFFVATAQAQGSINISPKGMDSLKVVDLQTVLWVNFTGSGNETAAHVMAHPRMTLMFCAFQGDPLILRLYGQAEVYHPRDEEWESYLAQFHEQQGARQIFKLTINKVQTSCGFGIPIMPYQEDRHILSDWAVKKGPEGLHEYWTNKNLKSIDGYETGIFE